MALQIIPKEVTSLAFSSSTVGSAFLGAMRKDVRRRTKNELDVPDLPYPKTSSARQVAVSELFLQGVQGSHNAAKT